MDESKTKYLRELRNCDGLSEQPLTVDALCRHEVTCHVNNSTVINTGYSYCSFISILYFPVSFPPCGVLVNGDGEFWVSEQLH